MFSCGSSVGMLPRNGINEFNGSNLLGLRSEAGRYAEYIARD
jgi:hypothetical protein